MILTPELERLKQTRTTPIGISAASVTSPSRSWEIEEIKVATLTMLQTIAPNH